MIVRLLHAKVEMTLSELEQAASLWRRQVEARRTFDGTVEGEIYVAPVTPHFDDMMTVEFVADIVGIGTFVLVINKYRLGKEEGESFVELLPLFYYEDSRDVSVSGDMFRLSFYRAYREVDDMILAVLPDLFKETLVKLHA